MSILIEYDTRDIQFESWAVTIITIREHLIAYEHAENRHRTADSPSFIVRSATSAAQPLLIKRFSSSRKFDSAAPLILILVALFCA